jgi:hypothetical protein
MPKFIYDEYDWSPIKKCSYCGKNFYPKNKEDFCNIICEQQHMDYIDGWEEWMLNGFYKEDLRR